MPQRGATAAGSVANGCLAVEWRNVGRLDIEVRDLREPVTERVGLDECDLAAFPPMSIQSTALTGK